ncbi:hypothetical protein F8388_010518 [Cannabis sativa]|uniref:Reverse transcriptase zinc-binding domain-containing protein n=1 Tax=Cannabis sativa TaxID=3483 RepID=A0A7J6GMZ9_CANSA|nr:hypothetical protein G4B88_016839 [Cannabis sativa]KAF4384920.1 hypothetical protein F8388_010518 [Cannabis sativa]
MVMSESQNLIDVPIGFSMDIPGLKESLPFAFGSSNNSIPKEQRQKVAVKKDAKKRKVSSLLNTKEEWNVDTLNNYFHKEDVPWILGIPIDIHSEDMLVWPFTKDGQYIVKSGYRVAREIKLAPTRCSNMDKTHAWWKMWWNLNLPPRMKLFGWKMCRNWLSAKSNLVHRGMKIDPTCNYCGRFEESLPHALWTCEKVERVWKLMPSYKLIKESRGHSMMDLLVEFRHKLAKEEFEDAVKPTAHTDQWQAPPIGTYCVHCDAAVQPNQAGVGLGYVWRDWLGNIVFAGMNYIPACCTVTVAEAKAVVAPIQDRPKSLHQSYEIRSDCKLLVDAISANGSSLGDMQPVVNQIKRHPEFSYCTKFCHVKRIQNRCS